jgi:hypothetical protein
VKLIQFLVLAHYLRVAVAIFQDDSRHPVFQDFGVLSNHVALLDFAANIVLPQSILPLYLICAFINAVINFQAEFLHCLHDFFQSPNRSNLLSLTDGFFEFNFFENTLLGSFDPSSASPAVLIRGEQKKQTEFCDLIFL